MQSQRQLLPVPPTWLAILGLLLLSLGFGSAVRADEPINAPVPSVPPLLVGVFYRYEVQIGAVLAQSGQGPLAVLPSLWLPGRNYKLADTIRDNAGIPEMPANLNPRDPKKLFELELQFGEVRAYFDALNKAYENKAPQFAASVEKTYPRYLLLKQPVRYRGVIVHLEGNLRRLRRFEAPLTMQLNGIRDIYEGWIFEKESAEPWCIVFPELPVTLADEQPLELAEKLNRPVAFDGYFFKAYGYTNQEKQTQVAPLLIGNSPVLKGPPEDGGTAPAMASWSPILLYGIVGIALVVILLGGGLTFWFRRSDARVRNKLTEIAHKNFVDPSELGDDVPPAAG